MDRRTSIANAVRGARSEAGMSQKEVAAALGKSVDTVGNWESGASSIPFDQIIAMSELFRMPVDRFVGRKTA